MNVLISGAGPAGLTAAYWLRRYGYRPAVVERAPSLVVGGYKIGVRGAASAPTCSPVSRRRRPALTRGRSRNSRA